MPCKLEYTDERFVFAGKSYPEVPLLVASSFHLVEPVCDYFRDLVIKQQLLCTSVKTYAQYIQQYWNFLEERGVEFQLVTDRELLNWLNQMEKKGNKNYVRAQRCDAVFDMYCWLQIKGYVHNLIRIPGHNDEQKFVPSLSCRKARPSQYRPSRYGIVWELRPNGRDANEVQPTPTSEDMTKIYVAADNPNNFDLTDRNILLIDWYAQVGLRRMEAQHLTIDQIPDWESIDKLRKLSHVLEMRLIMTKGRRPRHVGVLPQLLESTREWIDGPRAELVKRFKKLKGDAYKGPKEVFLSSKTGEVISLTSMSNLVRGFFVEAHVEGHGHRIRAHHLQNLIEAETDAAMATLVANGGSSASIDWELIIRKVAERAGHTDIETIRKYVTLHKKKYGRMAGRDDMVTVKQMLTAQKHELALVEHRLSEKKAELATLDARKK